MIPGASVHFLIALVWMFLGGNTTLGGLAVGLLAGFAIMAIFRQALGCEDYIRRVVGLVVFLGCFLREIAISNVRVAQAVFRPAASQLQGEFLTYSVADLNDFETLLLSQCISLTPGTIVAEKSKDGREIILHSFASGSPDEIRSSIDRSLKQPLLAFTR